MINKISVLYTKERNHKKQNSLNLNGQDLKPFNNQLTSVTYFSFYILRLHKGSKCNIVMVMMVTVA